MSSRTCVFLGCGGMYAGSDTANSTQPFPTLRQRPGSIVGGSGGFRKARYARIIVTHVTRSMMLWNGTLDDRQETNVPTKE